MESQATIGRGLGIERKKEEEDRERLEDDHQYGDRIRSRPDALD